MIYHVQREQDLWANLTGAVITCDTPNADLYKFQGQIKMPDGQLVPLNNE